MFSFVSFFWLICLDWYFWFPLYASACGVNLINGIGALSLKPIRKIAKLALWLGVFLFIKVAVEDFVYGIAGFWSLDLKEKVVREKFGSGFVVNSMYLQLQAASVQKDYVKRKEKKVPRYVECGEKNEPPGLIFLLNCVGNMN